MCCCCLWSFIQRLVVLDICISARVFMSTRIKKLYYTKQWMRSNNNNNDYIVFAPRNEKLEEHTSTPSELFLLLQHEGGGRAVLRGGKAVNNFLLFSSKLKIKDLCRLPCSMSHTLDVRASYLAVVCLPCYLFLSFCQRLHSFDLIRSISICEFEAFCLKRCQLFAVWFACVFFILFSLFWFF